jgi:hypothetical protein
MDVVADLPADAGAPIYLSAVSTVVLMTTSLLAQ